MSRGKKLPGANAKPLEGAKKEEWEKVKAAGEMAGLAVRSGDVAGVESALEALRSANLDPREVLNALHIPTDAGEHAVGLEKILRRIPDGWGRWIGCGPGWYPIIVELDQQLAGVVPDYEVHQVKEKFGGLRYYYAGPGHLVDEMDRLVRVAEDKADRTCEACGKPGRLHRTTGAYPWYQTLCRRCAKERGYVPDQEAEA